MQNINVLDSSIYNRISAGEVVERPASVVKELVENSLDAKATSIVIEIVKGGTELIKITDNGGGINFLDLKKAFLPHATSKIEKVEDLDKISTLGFRGEALPSIASVSKIELFSKTMLSEIGGKILLNAGIVQEVTEFACVEGTTIFVRNLFYNTPARLKFLKGIKQEENAVTNIVNRLMLANPNIYFKYIVDGKTIYNTATKSLKDKIYTIYGKECINELIEINAENEFYKMTGYISMPTFCKANKTYQTLIVNNRYVNNSLVSVAISNAYENFLMKGKFPIFVLSLELSNEDIDVNVHPSKLEIKFKDTKQVYNFFYSSILNALNDKNAPASYQNVPVFNNFIKEKVSTNTDSELKQVIGGFSFGKLQSISEELQNINVQAPTYKEDFSILKQPTEQEEKLFSNENIKTKELMNKNLFENLECLQKPDNENNIDKANFENKFKKDVFEQQKISSDIAFNIIGSIFNTYIVVEVEDSILLIDQHAGHERILFDKFIEQFNNKKIISQPLLIPFVFSVNEFEDDLITNNSEVFNELGFEIEPFGRLRYKIVSIPSILDGISLQDFIDDCLKDISKISKTNEVIKNRFATYACKAAVKGGKKLNQEEMKILISKIFNQNTVLLCPHGRPICVKLTKYEVEKMFKRIV